MKKLPNSQDTNQNNDIIIIPDLYGNTFMPRESFPKEATNLEIEHTIKSAFNKENDFIKVASKFY